MSLDVFKARCAAMRDERCTKAWGIEIELPTADSGQSEEPTQRLTPAELERRAREERRRVASASSGGPLLKLDRE